MSAPSAFTSHPGGRLLGELRVPGDKSVTHRALMLGALADGTTEITGPLMGSDCIATQRALAAMGVAFDTHEATIRVAGAGLHGLAAAPGPLDLGNAGTGIRLLAGLLAGQAFDSELTGDESLRRRPMARVAEPLQRMGAEIRTHAGCPPLHVTGGRVLQGIDYETPVPSAQVKSAILLAGLYARGETCVRESGVSRDHTERMLQTMGCSIDARDGRVLLRAPRGLHATQIDVPGDLSSAAFFVVAASLCPGSDLLLRDVGVNPTRCGLLDALRLMGAQIELLNPRSAGAEPVADLHVRSARLRGVRLPAALVPLAIDELPVLFIAAAAAEGETLITGAAELRVKESDRLEMMAEGLRALGVHCASLPDGLRIQGGRLRGGSVHSGGDHRVAMAFAVAGQIAQGPVRIADTRNVDTSFPGFLECARGAGFALEAA